MEPLESVKGSLFLDESICDPEWKFNDGCSQEGPITSDDVLSIFSDITIHNSAILVDAPPRKSVLARQIIKNEFKQKSNHLQSAVRTKPIALAPRKPTLFVIPTPSASRACTPGTPFDIRSGSNTSRSHRSDSVKSASTELQRIQPLKIVVNQTGQPNDSIAAKDESFGKAPRIGVREPIARQMSRVKLEINPPGLVDMSMSLQLGGGSESVVSTNALRDNVDGGVIETVWGTATAPGQDLATDMPAFEHSLSRKKIQFNLQKSDNLDPKSLLFSQSGSILAPCYSSHQQLYDGTSTAARTAYRGSKLSKLITSQSAPLLLRPGVNNGGVVLSPSHTRNVVHHSVHQQDNVSDWSLSTQNEVERFQTDSLDRQSSDDNGDLDKSVTPRIYEEGDTASPGINMYSPTASGTVLSSGTIDNIAHNMLFESNKSYQPPPDVDMCISLTPLLKMHSKHNHHEGEHATDQSVAGGGGGADLVKLSDSHDVTPVGELADDPDLPPPGSTVAPAASVAVVPGTEGDQEIGNDVDQDLVKPFSLERQLSDMSDSSQNIGGTELGVGSNVMELEGLSSLEKGISPAPSTRGTADSDAEFENYLNTMMSPTTRKYCQEGHRQTNAHILGSPASCISKKGKLFDHSLRFPPIYKLADGEEASLQPPSPLPLPIVSREHRTTISARLPVIVTTCYATAPGTPMNNTRASTAASSHRELPRQMCNSVLATQSHLLVVDAPRTNSTECVDYNSSYATTNSTATSSQAMNYQVHRRIMGWKLTTLRRRKDLLGILDMMHADKDTKHFAPQHPAAQHIGGAMMKEGVIPSEYFTPQSLEYYMPAGMDESQLGDNTEDLSLSEMRLRQAHAYEGSIRRMVKSRENTLLGKTHALRQEAEKKTLGKKDSLADRLFVQDRADILESVRSAMLACRSVEPPPAPTVTRQASDQALFNEFPSTRSASPVLLEETADMRQRHALWYGTHDLQPLILCPASDGHGDDGEDDWSTHSDASFGISPDKQGDGLGFNADFARELMNDHLESPHKPSSPDTSINNNSDTGFNNDNNNYNSTDISLHESQTSVDDTSAEN